VCAPPIITSIKESPMPGVRALSLSACLIPVTWSTANAAPPPRCGIWWDRSLCPELRTKEDAARVWSTWTEAHGFTDPPTPGTDIREHPEAMTLAQWAKSDKLEWGPVTHSDVAIQAQFDRLGLLTTIAPLLREPSASALDPADFTSVVTTCFRSEANSPKTMKISAVGSPDAPQVDMDDGSFGHRVWLAATGDLNGDGWQDWLIYHGGRIHEGTLGMVSSELLITRRGTGPLIDISNQLPDPTTGPGGLAAWRAATSAQPAWPEAKTRSFSGTMLIEGKRLGITMTLTCSNTLLTGSYRYDHVGKEIPLAGSVGARGSITLSEFPGPSIGTATFRLEPRADGTWSGQWDDAAFDTEEDFKQAKVTLKPTR
jgi:hypothetical protein